MIGRAEAIDKARTAKNSSKRWREWACLPALHARALLEEALQVQAAIGFPA